MDKQKAEAKEMVKDMSFGEKIKYFWDYYKVHTLIALVVAVLIAITVYQVVNTEKYDLEISYYGKTYITDEMKNEIEDKLEQYIEDLDGDGKKEVNLIVNNSLSEAEYAANEQIKFISEVSAASYSAYILDNDKYKILLPDDADDEDRELVSSYELNINDSIGGIIGESENQLYWCTVKPRNMEKASETEIGSYNNACRIESALKAE